METNEVYITNIAPFATEAALGEFFSQVGHVLSVNIKASAKGHTTRYGFLKFSDKASATKAVEQLSGCFFYELPLVVKYNTKKQQQMQQQLQKPGSYPQKTQQAAAHQAVPHQAAPRTAASAIPVEEHTVLVCHIDDPVTVWGQVVADKNLALQQQLDNSLPPLAASAPRLASDPKPNKIYAALFDEDDQWYRARVEGPVRNKQVFVRYIDYGNTSTVPVSNMIELPVKLLEVPALSSRYVIKDYKPAGTSGQKQWLDGVSRMSELVADKAVQMRVLRYEDFFSVVDVISEGVNVISTLAQEGLIRKTPIVSQEASAGATKSPPRNLPTPGSKKPFVSQPNSHVPAATNGGHNQSHHQSRILELEQMNISLDKQVKSLQAQARSQQARQASSKEESLSAMLKAVQESASHVRVIRRAFPSDESEDALQRTNRLLRSEPISRDEVVERLETSLAEYQQLQHNIRHLAQPDRDVLDEVCARRDESREQLHSEITSFLDNLNQLPLTQRRDQLHTAVRELEDDMKKYVKTPSSSVQEDSYQKFLQWKESVRERYQALRAATDSKLATVDDCLDDIRSVCSLAQPGVTTAPDLTSLMSSYQLALKEEISSTNLLVNTRGKELTTVRNAVSYLTRVARQEIDVINDLMELQDKYVKLDESLSPMLDGRPDDSELLSARKSVKQYKSQLRHALADKLDLEENDDADGDEVNEARERVREIRLQLQRALVAEESQLGALCQLHREHFPELQFIYPDLCLVTIQETGLVFKPGRSLDQYETSPLSVNHPSLLRGHFADQPILLRELVVDRSSDRWNVVNTNIKDYMSLQCQQLRRLNAVFNPKNSRAMYIEVPLVEMNLAEYIDRVEPERLCPTHILKDVITGLAALHSHGIVHGSVHPHNILISASTTPNAMLSEPNMLLSPAERSVHCTAVIGLRSFVSPEAFDKPMAISSKSDVYSAAATYLWMCCNDRESATKSTDISHLSVADDNRKLVASMLHKQPHKRCTAAEAMSLPVQPLIEAELRVLNATSSSIVHDENDETGVSHGAGTSEVNDAGDRAGASDVNGVDEVTGAGDAPGATTTADEQDVTQVKTPEETVVKAEELVNEDENGAVSSEMPSAEDIKAVNCSTPEKVEQLHENSTDDIDRLLLAAEQTLDS